ncbi:MAG TPA: hypothetical protein VFK02_06400 [Kofleriaceae bacterium]|nr:hypothetical protein [Kofleriaceae bacterium]
MTRDSRFTMLSTFIMKKQSKKPLVLSKETLRTLDQVDLTRIIGGAGGSVGHPLTCNCPTDQI